MSPSPLTPALAATVLGAALLASPSAAAPAAKAHPRLVDLETTSCVNCHGELIEDKAVVHPPVADDCTTCHEMTLGEEGTSVALIEAEPALCVFCHDDKEKAVSGELAAPHSPVTDSCLTCHDPHAGDNPQMLHEPVPQLCLDCHDLGDLEGIHGDQITEATQCVSCHQPHGSDNPSLLQASKLHPPFAEGSCEACHRQPFGERIRLRARGNKLCAACHGDVAKAGRAAGGSVHGALEEERGRAGCLNCHSPHMSAQGRLLLEPRPALCGECHGEIVAGALAPTGHVPAADDCLTCHQPHGSEQPRLLNDSPKQLCFLCHDPGDADLSKAHLGADPSRLLCIGCHTPHGNGNPKLLAKTVHPPLLDGCDTCHDGAYNKWWEGGSPDLCLLCHDDIGEAAEKAPVPHAAMEVGTCTDCHNPHATPQDKLIKSPGAGPCADCHDDKVAGPGEVAHGVIDSIGCRACHEPHGGTRENLLRAPGDELCLGCHGPNAFEVPDDAETVTLLGRFEVPADAARALPRLALSADGERNHPVAMHRVRGLPTEQELKKIETSFTGELTCLVCHDPHKGASKRLFRWGASLTQEACLHCHSK